MWNVLFLLVALHIWVDHDCYIKLTQSPRLPHASKACLIIYGSIIYLLHKAYPWPPHTSIACGYFLFSVVLVS